VEVTVAVVGVVTGAVPASVVPVGAGPVVVVGVVVPVVVQGAVVVVPATVVVGSAVVATAVVVAAGVGVAGTVTVVTTVVVGVVVAVGVVGAAALVVVVEVASVDVPVALAELVVVLGRFGNVGWPQQLAVLEFGPVWGAPSKVMRISPLSL
jgi:hypothetical protein